MNSGFLFFLSRTPVILGFLAATVLIGAGFSFVLQAIDGPLLDQISSGNSAIARLAQMDEYQRTAHFRGTVFLDSLYPLAYAGFFVGLLARLSGRWRWVVILLPISGMLADYAENAVQAMALSGHAAEVLLAKDIVTPLKFGGLLATLALCVILGIAALIRRLASKKIDDTQI